MAAEGEKIQRILIAKPGLDGHDQGAKVVVHALKEAGFEVIYSGLHQSPQQIAETALQEDVDAVGLSILSGAHLPLTEKVLEEMMARGIADKPVLVGGNIPARDHPRLKDLGVRGVFPTGTPFDAIVTALKEGH
ncbi:MAG: cobalamin B12-binding domain-containing protein [Planctomycetota bacterium]|jgi:methylmalonyl-CoA mutase C-terminal domain/subunit